MNSNKNIIDKLSRLERPVIKLIEGYVPSAVLVIFTIQNDELHLLFTHRTKEVKNHKDQVSFPGGVQQKDDVDLVQTAIRETYEEIGLRFSRDEVIYQLPEIISPTSYQIIPFVTYRKVLEKTIINEKEVLRVFTIPYTWLADFHNWVYEDYKTTSGRREVIIFKEFEGEKVWGLTAQIVVNLVNLLNK